ncbi:MAG TPA: DUF4394 domain-containing protein [Flavisolibacter sp.]|nr:DUF4394 domain-containing protein [Flavisolibacter sp.]
MRVSLSKRFFLTIFFATAILFSCKKEAAEDADIVAARAGRASLNIPNITFYALADNKLDQYTASSPETIMRTITISGLQSNEKITSIDFRPSNGQLFGISTTGQLYSIDLTSGTATRVGNTPVTLTSTITAFDFNPTVDRIRLVTASGQNFRLHPETGAIAATDGSINGQTGAMIAAAAYTNNTSTATTTILFDIDVASGLLFQQVPPNNGTLVRVGSLGFQISGEGGFDIAPSNDYGLAIFRESGKSTLFTIDLSTGRATIIAKYKLNNTYTGIAIPTR